VYYTGMTTKVVFVIFIS